MFPKHFRNVSDLKKIMNFSILQYFPERERTLLLNTCFRSPSSGGFSAALRAPRSIPRIPLGSWNNPWTSAIWISPQSFRMSVIWCDDIHSVKRFFKNLNLYHLVWIYSSKYFKFRIFLEEHEINIIKIPEEI